MYLHNNLLRIEKFVYDKGVNMALYNAEHSKTYIAFEKELKKALYAQIVAIANYSETLPLLMSLAKAVTPTTEELLSQVAVLVSTNGLESKIDLAIYLQWAGDQGGQAFFDKTGISAIFGVKDQRLVDYFSDYSKLIIESVDDYTKQWIAGKIQEGKDKGLTPFEIQKLLEADGKTISAIRAERITLTETAKAMNMIELEAAKNNGILEKIWRTSLDERVCPICGPMEGQRVSISTVFSGSRDFADGTVAETILVQHPPAHVSCRCYLEEVIPTDWIVPEKIWVG